MKNTELLNQSDVAHEFAGLNLGDPRRSRRVRLICAAWSKSPSSSLPKAMHSEAALEGAYRLLNNDRVDGVAVSRPHIKASWARAAQASRVLSLEDTTEMRFGGVLEREGLGELAYGGRGFFMHTSLLVSLTDSGVVMPLGVGAYEVMVRDANRVKLPAKQAWKDPNCESHRWQRVSAEVGTSAEEHHVRVTHVGDREADDYAWLESVLARDGSFVVRNVHNRRVQVRTGSGDSQTYLRDLVTNDTPVRATRTVSFEARTLSGGRRRRDPRAKRKTVLEVRASPVVLVRPDKTLAQAKSLAMNIVVVTEPHPPEGEAPIEWQLLTSEPIETEKDVLAVVDAYRARWTIEEFFKALKTGCGYERLQLESLHALHNALAICLPIAWRLLLLRSVSRDEPDSLAENAMPAEHLAALKLIGTSKSNRWGLRLKNVHRLTAQDALHAVARLGGHLKRNGAPGWITIMRGYEVLDQMVELGRLLSERKG